MTSILQDEYQPDIVSSPGETLLETLEAIDMSQAELAKRMGRPTKTINEIIQAKTAITTETALQLEKVLNIPASFWIKREQQYRESLARQVENLHFQDWQEWLNDIPIKTMMKRGWIPQTQDKLQQTAEVLKFFGVASPDAWHAIWDSKNVAYRKSKIENSHFSSIAVWLRQGEIEAQKIECAPYDSSTFQDVLYHIRALTTKSTEVFQNELVQLCATAGVAVVFIQELPNTGISGATQWLTPKKALILLSLRYKTSDQLWFTFFHESGHILLHGKRQVFLEIGQKDGGKEEKEADEFARDILIPRIQWDKFLSQRMCRTKVGILEFAKTTNIAAGIIVGRLQHEKLIQYKHCNDLKERLRWVLEIQNE